MPLPLRRLESLAFVLAEDDIDTDAIVPARFLMRTTRAGMGDALFHDRRRTPDGAPKPGFPLDDPRRSGASILIAGANFGCGSSREHAVWALVDAGVRCVVAASFSDIFLANAGKNGLLPIALGPVDLASVRHAAEADRVITIDVAAQRLLAGDVALDFPLSPLAKRALLEGLDEIALILSEHGPAIDAFEARRSHEGWTTLDPAALRALTA